LKSYYHYDGQLSTRQLTDASGNVTDTYTYDAFGLLINRSGANEDNYLYNHIKLDEYVIIPNHIHGIVIINDDVGAGLKPAPTSMKRHGLPEIVRGFKTFSSRRINQYRNTPGQKLWQRNYYEHIIRNDDELNRIREYIINNPLEWEMDRNHPDNIIT